MGRFWLPVVCRHKNAVASGLIYDYIERIANDRVVKIWSPVTGELIRNLNGHTKGLSDIAWSADSVYLASASDDHTIRMWDVDSVSLNLHYFQNKFDLGPGTHHKSAQRSFKLRILCQL